MLVHHGKSRNEKGYVLLSVMLLMTLMLITLSIELPRIAQQIRRSKEEELIHRGEQYRIAIKRFHRKNGRYPASLEQLESTNNMRFLRRRYKDPFTGKDEWRILHVGEVQLNPTNGGLNAAGQAGNGSIFSSPFNSGSGGMQGSATGGAGPASTGTTGTGGTIGAGGTTNTGASSGTVLSSPGSSTGSFSLGGGNTQFGGAGIIGIASTSKEKSIKELNGKDHYNDWLFVYDPRLDAQQNGVPGGGQQPPGSNILGQPNNQPNPPGNSPPPVPAVPK